MSNQMSKAQLVHQIPSDPIVRAIAIPVYREGGSWQVFLAGLDLLRKPGEEIFWIKTIKRLLKSLTVN
jgi:hypothetical protein